VRIHAVALAAEADGVALQTADHHSDRHHHQQPFDAARIAQSAVLQM
jgi:hypothetical protein